MSSRHHELNHAHLCFSLIFAVFEIICHGTAADTGNAGICWKLSGSDRIMSVKRARLLGLRTSGMDHCVLLDAARCLFLLANRVTNCAQGMTLLSVVVGFLSYNAVEYARCVVQFGMAECLPKRQSVQLILWWTLSDHFYQRLRS